KQKKTQASWASIEASMSENYLELQQKTLNQTLHLSYLDTALPCLQSPCITCTWMIDLIHITGEQ
ncbi:hypothetical protein CROQUDRAFT_52176, partial [Cronartium quercuum f. sp. fusiforme G11]